MTECPENKFEIKAQNTTTLQSVIPNITANIETGMGPITDRMINELINGFAIDNYKDKINDKLVDPLTSIINRRMQPYVYLSGGLYIVIIVLLLIIIYVLITKKH